MSSTQVVHHPSRGSRLGATPTTWAAWAAGGLALLYAIGIIQYVTPVRFIGLGIPTAIALVAGACGLYALVVVRDRSWMAWLGVAAAVLAVIVTVVGV